MDSTTFGICQSVLIRGGYGLYNEFRLIQPPLGTRVGTIQIGVKLEGVPSSQGDCTIQCIPSNPATFIWDQSECPDLEKEGALIIKITSQSVLI